MSITLTSLKTLALFLVLMCSILLEATSAPTTVTTESPISSTATALTNKSSTSSLENTESSSSTIQISAGVSISDLLNYTLPENVPTTTFTIFQDSATTLIPTKESNYLDELIDALFSEKFTAGIIYSPPTSTIAPFMDIPVSYQNLFANDLFAVIAKNRSQENVVYSPISIQICLALAFMGAEGETAENMRNILRLGEKEKPEIAKRFSEFLKSVQKSDNSTEEPPHLRIVNRLYIKPEVNVTEEFNYFAKKYFDTLTEKVNFSDANLAVQQINKWVEQQTDYKIRNLMSKDSLSSSTNAILINAIYFKNKWLNPFSLTSTSQTKFYLNFNQSQDIEMMFNEAYYNYIELPELKASALEMPYENSNLSMLIILPNEISGLEELELKLSSKDLNEITYKMVLKKVLVYIPKFTLEFDIDLKEPLEKMGLADIFSKQANFKGLFEESEYRTISEIKHKAFLNVNEAGSEAAAASFATLTALSAPFDEPTFRADHPFMFAIRSPTVIYFEGHVVSI